MKERITYILAEGEQGVNPSNVQVSSDSLKLPGLRAAKEWRITLSTKELPREVNTYHRAIDCRSRLIRNS